jgi:predicted kinase
MPKLTILRGISGSGKSTEAKTMTDNNYYRVNRDELRPMLYSGKWSGDKEKVVVAAERAIVTALLESGKSVVVDDTNLLDSHRNMWKQIVENVNIKHKTNGTTPVEFKVKEIRTSLVECILRDLLRKGDKYIGENVIQRQAMKSGMYNLQQTPNSIVLCDIDGTIANGDHRVGLLKDKKDRDRWLKYYALCKDDKPIQSIIDKLKEHKASGKDIILVSGRASELTLYQTQEWLARYDVPFDRLLMRNKGDGRPDVQVKTDILNEILLHHPKESIYRIYDDRPNIVLNCWVKAGLPVDCVYKGEIVECFINHKDDCNDIGKPISGRCIYCGALEDF